MYILIVGEEPIVEDLSRVQQDTLESRSTVDGRRCRGSKDLLSRCRGPHDLIVMTHLHRLPPPIPTDSPAVEPTLVVHPTLNPLHSSSPGFFRQQVDQRLAPAVIGLNRRRNTQTARYVERATGEWTDCPVGITASEKSTPPKTRVQEVAGEQEGVRVFVVDSEERKAYELAEREKAMGRVREALEKLQQRVETGRLKAPEKIGAAAARILGKNHGSRYYDWALEDGHFRYFEHPVKLAREKNYEGK